MQTKAGEKLASVTLTGALVIGGAVGIVSVQAFVPADAGLVAQAQAATTKAGWYGGASKPVTGYEGITSIKLSGSKMKVKTSKGLNYRKTKTGNGKTFSKKSYTFKLSSKAKYYGTSSKWAPIKLSKAEGRSRLKRVGGYALNWKVKGGKVVRVEFFGK